MSDNLYDSSYILEIQELNTAEAAAAAALAASDNSTPQVWESGEVITVSGSSGGGGGASRDLVVTTYTVATAFSGASVGDIITCTQVIDVTSTPSTVTTIWRNQTTATDLVSVPSFSNLALEGTSSLTNAQLRATAVNVSSADTSASGTLNSATLNSVYVININGQGVASFVITGLTASGATLMVEASDDSGTTWNPVNGITPSTGILFSSIAVDSQFRVNSGGRTNLRLRVSTIGTGTITVVSNISFSSSVVALSSPLPTGSNTIGNVGIVGSVSITPASDLSTTGTISAISTGVALAINGVSGAYITLGGTWSGTIQFQGLAPDSTTWIPLYAATGGPTNPYAITGTSSNGGSRLMAITGFKQIRAYATAWTSGTANVYIEASSAGSTVESIQLNQANLAVNINSLDNTILYNGTVSASGALTGIDTTGYQSIVVEVQGSSWNGIIEVETNTDNGTPWNNLQMINTDRSGLAEFIASNGVFITSVTGRYIRINVLEMVGTVSITVLGRTVQSMSAIDLLSQALDPKNNIQLQVAETSLKRDQSNALVLSDGPAPVQVQGLVNTIILIDTLGYQSLQFTSNGIAGSVTTSNDNINFSALTGAPVVLGPLVTAISANASFIFPILARWIKITVTTAGTGTYFLRNAQFNPLYTTTPYIAGAGGVNGGVAGTLSIGGNIAVGSAPTANPAIAGTIDTAGNTRRVLSDVTGKIITASFDASGKPITYTYDQTATNRILNSISPAYSSQNVSTLPVSDQTLFEGQNFVELLGMILLELRVQNQLLHQIGMGNAIVDEPNVMRQDQTLYAI